MTTAGARQTEAACNAEGSRSGGNAESQIHSSPSVYGTFIIQSSQLVLYSFGIAQHVMLTVHPPKAWHGTPLLMYNHFT